jgi:hypothetical protein
MIDLNRRDFMKGLSAGAVAAAFIAVPTLSRGLTHQVMAETPAATPRYPVLLEILEGEKWRPLLACTDIMQQVNLESDYIYASVDNDIPIRSRGYKDGNIECSGYSIPEMLDEFYVIFDKGLPGQFRFVLPEFIGEFQGCPRRMELAYNAREDTKFNLDISIMDRVVIHRGKGYD